MKNTCPTTLSAASSFQRDIPRLDTQTLEWLLNSTCPQTLGSSIYDTCPQPCRGSPTHPLRGPRPKDPRFPAPARPPSEVPKSRASPAPGPLGALTGLALLPPGAGRRRGRCGAATSLQLVRWGRRRGGHGVGDPGQRRRRGTDAPSARTIAEKGSRGQHKPPRCGHPE